MIKEGDVNLLAFYSRLCNMEITLREFLAMLIEFLDTNHILLDEEVSPSDLQFLEQIFSQSSLQQREIERAASLLPCLAFEERLRLERFLLSGKFYDFKRA